MPKQVPTASNGAGKATAVEGATQALNGGRKATEATAMATSWTTNTAGSTVVENASQAKRTVDIATLSEDEVLSMMHGIVKGMVEFANNTKNVHRELKDKLKNTGLLLSQFLRLRKGSGAVLENQPGVQKVADYLQLQSMELKVAQMVQEQTTFFQQMKAQQTELQAQQQEWLLKLEERQKERAVIEELNRKTYSQAGEDSRSGYAVDEAEMLAGRRFPRRRRGAKKSANASKPQANEQPMTRWSRGQMRSNLMVNGPKLQRREGSKRPGSRADVAVNLVRSRNPKTEAITIGNPKEGTTYAEVMKKVLAEVDFQEMGVEVCRTRRTKTGSILLEVKGKSGADALASRLRVTIGDQARVSRPVRTTKVLVINIADWLENDRVIEDIRSAVEGLSLAPISVRENTGGGRVAIVTAPMDIALRLAAAGAIKVGIGRCQVKLLESKKVRCFRCDEWGHMSKVCTASSSGKKCFRCKEAGHLIADCPATSASKERLGRVEGPGRPTRAGPADKVTDALNTSVNQYVNKEAASLVEADPMKA